MPQRFKKHKTIYDLEMLSTFLVDEKFNEMLEEQCKEVENMFEDDFFQFNDVQELIVVHGAINNTQCMFTQNILTKSINSVINYFIHELDLNLNKPYESQWRAFRWCFHPSKTIPFSRTRVVAYEAKSLSNWL